MKHGCSIVAAIALVLSLYSAALAQVSYPQAMAEEASPYPGAAVVMAGKGADGIQAMLTTPDAPEKVVAHYRSQLAPRGWEVAQEMDMPQVRTISFERGESTFTVAAMPQGDGQNTMITLVLETK